MNNKTRVLASLGLVLATIIWGFAFVVVKNTLDLIPALYMMAFRFTIAFLGQALLFHKKFKLINKKILINGFVLGLLLYLSYAFQTYGCKYTTAGKNAFLTTIYVVLVPFINWILFSKKPKWYSVIAAFMAITGIGLVSLTDNLTINIGDVLTIFCGITYAIHMIFVSRYTETGDAILLTILQIGFTAVLSWVTAPILDGPLLVSFVSSESIISIFYLGLLSTMVAYLLQNVGQKYTKPSTAALLMSLESVFGMLFSVIFLHEVLTPRMVIGCAVIFIAIVISELVPTFGKNHFVKPEQT